jgi:hypothetical protein
MTTRTEFKRHEGRLAEQAIERERRACRMDEVASRECPFPFTRRGIKDIVIP